MNAGDQERELRERFSLTVVEARLLAWLVKGKSVEEAAAAIGLTQNTGRAYLKRILTKFGGALPGDLDPLLVEPPRGPKPRKDGAEAPLEID
jgi:DNA-binding CsgD family transcriptional regulator